MTIPTKPDFAKAYQSTNEILVTSSVITKFPFSTKELVTKLFANQAPLVCRSYRRQKNMDWKSLILAVDQHFLPNTVAVTLSFMTIQS